MYKHENVKKVKKLKIVKTVKILIAIVNVIILKLQTNKYYIFRYLKNIK